MMRIAIIGANGQLGSDLVKVFSARTARVDLVPLTHKDIEVCDYAGARATLSQVRPDVVINTAAYHKVDECEENVTKAFEVNAFAVRNLAQVCRDLDATLVHMSTDYVFGGEKREPYTEVDLPNPLNVYGVSKLAGEYFVRNVCPKHFIVRSSGLYGIAGSSGKGGNFVELMLRLARQSKEIRVVDDQILAPTYSVDLARKIAQLITTDQYGVYHVTNNGQCSWYQFAQKVFELSGLSPKLSPTTTAAFGARARRPAYSALRNAALEALGLDDLRPWPEALAAYLAERMKAG